MKKIVVFLVLVICLSRILTLAQTIDYNDSIIDRAKIQSDANILYQQQVLDSLVKIRLLNDLQDASGNSRKTRELEKKLKQIEANDSLRKLELLAKLESIRKNVKGSAVAPFNDTLFLIYSRIASYTPEDRASNITNRILNIYKDPFFKPDSIYLMQTEQGTEIVYQGEFVIMVVTSFDALYYNKDDYQLAEDYLKIIRKSLVDERQANSVTSWLIRIGKVAVIILGLGLLIFLINKLFGFVNKFITSNRAKYGHGFTISKIRLLSPEQLEMFIQRVSKLLRIFVIALAVYLSLPLLFSIFPETKTLDLPHC